MTLGRSAVVLGGSVAGLCAAGALADHFDEVTILERDLLPADAEHRRGVPQSKHPHFLLNAGRRSIGTLFPGFEDDLIAAGGMPLMPSLDAAYLEETGWAPRKKSTMTMIYSSRILIERVLRDRVRALPNVTIREGVAVQALEYADAGGPDGAVTGVRFQAGDSEPERLSTDLVVDALGRGSSVSDWLVAAGWPQVPVKTLDAKVTYISRWYDLPPEGERPDSWWWRHVVVMPAQGTDGNRPAEHAFLSNFFPLENGRAIACMGSWGLEMPRTVEDFTSSAERLRTPVFAAAMKQSTPTSEVHLTRSTGNKWRRYDQLPSSPRGLVFVGDSICAFNPFYGQGMSSAARSAVLLQTALAAATALDDAFVADFVREQVTDAGCPVEARHGQGPGLRVRDRHGGAAELATTHRRGDDLARLQRHHRCRAGGRGDRRALRARLQPRRDPRGDVQESASAARPGPPPGEGQPWAGPPCPTGSTRCSTHPAPTTPTTRRRRRSRCLRERHLRQGSGGGHPRPGLQLPRRRPRRLLQQPGRPWPAGPCRSWSSWSSAAPSSRWCMRYAAFAATPTRPTWPCGSPPWSTWSSPSRRCTSPSGSASTRSTASSSPTTSSPCSSCMTACRSTSWRSTRRSVPWPTRWCAASASSRDAAPSSARSAWPSSPRSSTRSSTTSARS